MSISYRKLLEKLHTLSDEELDMDITICRDVNGLGSIEFFPVSNFIRADGDELIEASDGVLEEGQWVLVEKT